MSSLYLSEVHSINLVKRIQGAKILPADTWLSTEDQMATQMKGKYRARTRQEDKKQSIYCGEKEWEGRCICGSEMSPREIHGGEAVSENDRIWLLLSPALRCKVAVPSMTTHCHYMQQNPSRLLNNAQQRWTWGKTSKQQRRHAWTTARLGCCYRKVSLWWSASDAVSNAAQRSSSSKRICTSADDVTKAQKICYPPRLQS